MSFDTWRILFYSEEAEEVPTNRALAHSIRKWEGLLKKNLKEHGLITEKGDTAIQEEEGSVLFIDGDSCALCVAYVDFGLGDKKIGEECLACPLYAARGNVSCYAPKAGEHKSPYDRFVEENDARPMLNWLKKTQKLPPKISQFELAELYSDWQIALQAGMDHQRFGQYVMNNDPRFRTIKARNLFYEEDAEKAFGLLVEKYGRG